LPRCPVRDGRKPAHIGEALLPSAVGNPEGSPSDPVTTDPKGEVGLTRKFRKQDEAHNTPALVNDRDAYGVEAPLDPWYVSGLAEGEGCFCISFALRAKLRTGVEVRPSFALSLNERDLALLEDLQAFFGCGWIRRSRGDRTFKYEVRSSSDLLESVVPHFERFPLVGVKGESFRAFARVCRMIEQGDHLQRPAARRIVSIAYEMNLGRRRIPRDQLLRALGEVKG
jgi:LAGLIDADG endonuclease